MRNTVDFFNISIESRCGQKRIKMAEFLHVFSIDCYMCASIVCVCLFVCLFVIISQPVDEDTSSHNTICTLYTPQSALNEFKNYFY